MLVTPHGKWISVALNRPDKLNPLDFATHSRLMEAVIDAIDERNRGLASALALTKEALRGTGFNDFDQQLALEAELQGKAGRGPDYAEGVLAHLERRPARFAGSEESGSA